MEPTQNLGNRIKPLPTPIIIFHTLSAEVVSSLDPAWPAVFLPCAEKYSGLARLGWNKVTLNR